MTSTRRAYPTRVDVTFRRGKGQVMLDRIRTVDISRLVTRLGRLPERLLVDTKPVTQDESVAFAEDAHAPITVCTPPPHDKPDATPASVRRRDARRRKEPAALKEWRARMAGEDGKAVYRRRRRIETVNADFKNHGLHRLRLHGLDKVRCAALLHAIAHNIRRGIARGCRRWLPRPLVAA